MFHVLLYMWSPSTTVSVTTENSKPPSSDCCLIVDRIRVPQLQLQVLDELDRFSPHSVANETLETNFYLTLGQFHLLYHYVK